MPTRAAPPPECPAPRHAPRRSQRAPLPTADDPPLPAPEPLWLYAADGYRLGAMRYRAPARVAAHLVVAGAIGVPQRFYRRFAAHAQARGCVVWTLDYRGIGRSGPTDARGAPASLRGFRADLLDWGRLDLAVVVRAASELARHERDGAGVPVHVVAHSFGGHALGLLPEPERVHACYTLGTGAGWHGWMPRGERMRVLALWHVIGPTLTGALGYTPWRRLGMGEDLPLGVYRQWKRWCAFRHYWFDDPAAADAMRAAFGRVRMPIAAANATDDPWSPPPSRDAFLLGFRNAPLTRVDLDPQRSGLGPIGHLGYFRPPARPLWDAVLGWLAAHGATAPRR